MRVMTGTVRAGKVVLDEDAVADGTDVWVVTADAGETAQLSAAEHAEVEAGIAEADRGELIEGDAWLARLRSNSRR